mmetsp:Transcript_40290/g.121349  ORF Transcript_40290/g.121349 Transcript_40290/m.121349 type:complete len:497 (-) Transcript_40290:30-1520(-)
MESTDEPILSTHPSLDVARCVLKANAPADVEVADWDDFPSVLCHPKAHNLVRLRIQGPGRPLEWLLRLDPPLSAVEALLEMHGEEIFSEGNASLAGMTPLHQASRYGSSPEIVRAVLRAERSAASRVDRSGSPPLFYARDAETAQLLLEDAPDSVAVVNHRVSWLPLHACADDPDRGADLANVLIEAGWNAGMRGGGAMEIDVRGRTPLDLVCKSMEGHSMGGVVSPEPSPENGAHAVEWNKLEVILRAAHEDCRASAKNRTKLARKPQQPFPKSSPLICRDTEFLVPHASVELLAHRHPAIVRQALHFRPNEVYWRDERGKMPLHVLTSSTITSDACVDSSTGLERSLRFGLDWEKLRMCVLDWVLEVDPSAARRPDWQGRLPLHLALTEGGWRWGGCKQEQKSGGRRAGSLERLIHADPRMLAVRDSRTGLLPFMLAALREHNSLADSDEGGSLDTSYRLLLEDPSVLLQFCGQEEHHHDKSSSSCAVCMCVIS